MGKKIHRDQTIIEQLTHEIAWFKRHKFAKRSEQLSPDQGSLLDDLLDTDIAAAAADVAAALLAGKVVPQGPTVCILSGANIDPALHARIMAEAA